MNFMAAALYLVCGIYFVGIPLFILVKWVLSKTLTDHDKRALNTMVDGLINDPLNIGGDHEYSKNSKG